MQMQQQSQKVFISNCDTPVGYAMARDFLNGKFRDRFYDVVCGVHKATRSADLMWLGGCVAQLPSDASDRDIHEHLRNCETLVLVPNIGSSEMVNQCEQMIRACRQAQVKRCLLVSLLGCEDNEVHLAQKFKKIEEMFEQCDIENRAVVRHGIFQQSMYLWKGELQQNQRLALPIKPEAQYAPLNLCDLTMFCAHIIAERGIRGKSELFKLTGNELVNGNQLVDKLNKAVNTNIQYHHIEREKAKQWLNRLLKNDTLVNACLDICDLINRGKMSHVSNDEKKNTGQEPIHLDKFFKDNSIHFKPHRQ